MSTHEPARTMTCLSVVVLIAGVGALALGLMLYRYQHAVDVGVQADQELIDRLNRNQAISSGSVMSLDRYASASLGYHQAIRGLYRSLANTLLLGGAGLTITGGLQLVALRRLRRGLTNSEHPKHESAAT